MDDAALIAQVRAGKINQFAELVNRYQGEVRNVLMVLLAGENEQVDECVQEVFVKAYADLHNFRKGGEFRHWIKGIARNVARMHWRSHSRKRRHLQAFREHMLQQLSIAGKDHWQEDAIDALQQCRQKLPEHVEEVIRLRYQQTWDIPDIAERTGKTVTAVTKMLSRARGMLRKCIERRVDL